MSILAQICVIFGICLISEGISAVLPFTFPSSVLAMVILLILLVPGAIVLVNLYILLAGLMENSVLNYILCAIPIVVFVFAWNYVFPLTAKFENTIQGTFANAFVLSVLHLPTTVALTVLNLIPLAVFLFFTNFFYKTLVIWVLLVFALIAKINSLLLRRVFDRHMQEPAAA